MGINDFTVYGFLLAQILTFVKTGAGQIKVSDFI